MTTPEMRQKVKQDVIDIKNDDKTLNWVLSSYEKHEEFYPLVVFKYIGKEMGFKKIWAVYKYREYTRGRKKHRSLVAKALDDDFGDFYDDLDEELEEALDA